MPVITKEVTQPSAPAPAPAPSAGNQADPNIENNFNFNANTGTKLKPQSSTQTAGNAGFEFNPEIHDNFNASPAQPQPQPQGSNTGFQFNPNIHDNFNANPGSKLQPKLKPQSSTQTAVAFEFSGNPAYPHLQTESCTQSWPTVMPNTITYECEPFTESRKESCSVSLLPNQILPNPEKMEYRISSGHSDPKMEYRISSGHSDPIGDKSGFRPIIGTRRNPPM